MLAQIPVVAHSSNPSVVAAARERGYGGAMGISGRRALSAQAPRRLAADLLAAPWAAASESEHGIDTATYSLVRFNVRTFERNAFL